MTKTRSIYAMAASAGVALALLAGTGAAQARDVNWSVGIGVPGVVVGASNGYYAPPPAYYAPPPVVYYGDRGYRHHRHHRHHGYGHGYGHGRWDR